MNENADYLTTLREMNPDDRIQISVRKLLQSLHGIYVSQSIQLQFEILAAETRSMVGPSAPIYLERDDVVAIIREADELYGEFTND